MGRYHINCCGGRHYRYPFGIGDTGPTGSPETTGSTGPEGNSTSNYETVKLGDINAVIPFNAGAGNNQATGPLVFGDGSVVSTLSTYIVQTGATTGAL
jgi:hypothetical protein